MNVILYATSSDKRKLNKALTPLQSMSDVTIKDTPNSITNPVIIVSTFPTWKQCNYVYIEEYGRYYFVDDMQVLAGLRVELTCRVDVLMSNRDYINNLNAIVSRSSLSNDYLVDSEQGMLNYRTQKIINFPDNRKFNTSLQYVLTVAGGGGSV